MVRVREYARPIAPGGTVTQPVLVIVPGGPQTNQQPVAGQVDPLTLNLVLVERQERLEAELVALRKQLTELAEHQPKLDYQQLSRHLPPITVQHVGNQGQVYDQMNVHLGETMKLRFDTKGGR